MKKIFKNENTKRNLVVLGVQLGCVTGLNQAAKKFFEGKDQNLAAKLGIGIGVNALALFGGKKAGDYLMDILEKASDRVQAKKKAKEQKEAQ